MHVAKAISSIFYTTYNNLGPVDIRGQICPADIRRQIVDECIGSRMVVIYVEMAGHQKHMIYVRIGGVKQTGYSMASCHLCSQGYWRHIKLVSNEMGTEYITKEVITAHMLWQAGSAQALGRQVISLSWLAIQDGGYPLEGMLGPCALKAGYILGPTHYEGGWIYPLGGRLGPCTPKAHDCQDMDFSEKCE